MSCVKLIILATDTRNLRLKWLQQSVKGPVPRTTHLYFGNRRLGQRCTWTSREPCGFPVFTFKAPTATTLLTCPQVLCVPENRYGACRPLTENLKYSSCYHEPYYPIHPTKPFGTPYSLLIQPILHKSLIRLQLYLDSWAKRCHSHMLENLLCSALLFCSLESSTVYVSFGFIFTLWYISDFLLLLPSFCTCSLFWSWGLLFF